MRTLRGPPNSQTPGDRRVPEAGIERSSLFRVKAEERGGGAAAPHCACARFQKKKKFFFLTFAVLSSPKPKCLVQ